MWGTIINTATVLLGTSAGLFIGNRLNKRMQESVMTAIGLVTLYVGISNTSQTGNIIIPLLSLLAGAIIGEMLNIDAALKRLGDWLQLRFGNTSSAPIESTDVAPDGAAVAGARFVNGFVTASLVFCVGPLTFLGALQDGMGIAAGFQMLLIKSILDMFTGMAFAATFGIGVMFSAATVLFLQGGLAIMGRFSGEFMTAPMINEMSAVGGLILMGIALVLLDVKKPRVANYLPALIIAPLMVAIAAFLGIDIYPL